MKIYYKDGTTGEIDEIKSNFGDAYDAKRILNLNTTVKAVEINGIIYKEEKQC